MGWFTAVVLYVLIWWTVLFAVLPLWVQTEDRPDPVTGWRGAPLRPLLGRKLLLTTLLALVIWGAAAAVIESGWISFRRAAQTMPDD